MREHRNKLYLSLTFTGVTGRLCYEFFKYHVNTVSYETPVKFSFFTRKSRIAPSYKSYIRIDLFPKTHYTNPVRVKICPFQFVNSDTYVYIFTKTRVSLSDPCSGHLIRTTKVDPLSETLLLRPEQMKNEIYREVIFFFFWVFCFFFWVLLFLFSSEKCNVLITLLIYSNIMNCL